MSSWEISGTYLVNCNCQLICPCAVDGRPTAPDNKCTVAALFHVASGNLDNTDLSGADFAFWMGIPSNPSAGGWKVGLVVDEGASEAQASALEKILHGEAGGEFADLSGFYGEWLGVERGKVTISGGDTDTPSGAVGDRANFSFEPLRGPDGGVTTIKNAMFGFAPEYKIGKATGRSDLFGVGFDSVYGETADFTFASEPAENAATGRA